MSLSRIDSNAIAANAISAADLAESSITEAKIADGAVTPNKISGEVPVTKGGTGVASLTTNAVLLGNGTSAVATVSAGTSGNVLTSDGTAWISKGISAGGNLNVQVYTANATWTKPSNLKAVKVTVVGAGGGGYAGPSGSGGTGGTSSFGAFASSTGGVGGPVNQTPTVYINGAGLGGIGSGGNINIAGTLGLMETFRVSYDPATFNAAAVQSSYTGGSTPLGAGGSVTLGRTAQASGFGGGGGGGSPSTALGGGGGGGGTSILYLTAPNIPGPVSITIGVGGTRGPTAGPLIPLAQLGANGVVVVEEFY